MWTLLLILLVLAVGIAAGWYAGSYFARQENHVLEREVDRLEQFAARWGAEARGSYELSHTVTQQHASHIAATLQNIVGFLQHLQQQPTSVAPTDKHKVDELLAQAQQLMPLQGIPFPGNGSEENE